MESDGNRGDTSNDKTRCPLCGERNNCARETDPNASDCWCRSTHFPAELLAQIPASERGQRCICAACAEEAARLATPANSTTPQETP